MSASSSTASVHRIEIRRLLRASSESLTTEQREALLDRVERGSFQGALEVLACHPTFGSSPRVVTALLERFPAEFSHPDALLVVPHLVQALDVDSYAELVLRVVPRLTPESRFSGGRVLVAGLRGSRAFDRLVQAETDIPRIGDESSVVFELAGSGLRYDDINRPRRMAELAQATPARAVYCWCIARAAGDAAVEGTLRPQIMGLVDFKHVGGPGVPAWRWSLHAELIQWLNESADRTAREELVLGLAVQAHASGTTWESIAHYLRDAPESLREAICARSLDSDTSLGAASGVLANELKTGSAEAWQRFFRWCATHLPGHYGDARKLIREGVLPECPSADTWSAFLSTSAAIVRAEEEQIAFALEGIRRHIRADHSEFELEHGIQRALPNVFPRLTADELLGRILDRPPCAATVGALVAGLRLAPKRLNDPRVAGFGPFARTLEHAELPGIEHLGRLDDAGMTSFLSLHGACGPTHVREWMRSSPDGVDSHALWYAERPWMKAVLDDDLQEELRQALLRAPLNRLVQACENVPTWVTREDVLAEFRRRPDEPLRVAGLPDWLDPVLLESAQTTKDAEMLRQLFVRFRRHPAHRRDLFEALLRQLESGELRHAANFVGDMLDSRSAWETYGAGIVYRLLKRGRETECAGLVLGDLTGSVKDPDEASSTGTPRMVAMHLAFARGLLRWAGDQCAEGNHDAAERPLMAIGLLDPPRLFTRELRDFARSEHVNDGVREWVANIHKVAKSADQSDASPGGLFECMRELTRRDPR